MVAERRREYFRWRSFVVRNFAARSWLSLARFKISRIYFSPGNSRARLFSNFLPSFRNETRRFAWQNTLHCSHEQFVLRLIRVKNDLYLILCPLRFFPANGKYFSQIAYAQCKHHQRESSILRRDSKNSLTLVKRNGRYLRFSKEKK